MKITITGSLGNISHPLAEELIQKGHAVTVISSNPQKQKDIEALGAIAAIGSLEDAAFLTKTFTGADAVYSMVPPGNYFDPAFDLLAHYRRLGKNYAKAIEQSGVQRVVNLSSIGAHLEKGNGILVGANNVEQILNELPSNVAITHIRPTSFYYNLLPYAHMVKAAGFIAANYGGEDIVPWVSPKDIAAAIAEELTTPLAGRKVRYVASEDVSCSDTAKVLGEAIGKPDLQWKTISSEEMLASMTGMGMNATIAAGLVEMYHALHTGLLAEDYYRNKPVMGKVKLKDYAIEFATVYNQN